MRLTGQDTERGTFAHRHLVLHDVETGEEYVPIQNLEGAEALVEVHNSPLSEMGALGFEYGYSVASPEALVLWEAQFGDFVNAAQVIVDQFIVSGLSKWNQTSRLTLLLPHGYEGMGPSTRARDSSASCRWRRRRTSGSSTRRPRRSTSMSSGGRPSTRRRGRSCSSRPRACSAIAKASSHVDELASGSFRPVLDDPMLDDETRRRAERLVICTGKIYYDVVGHDGREARDEIAVARLEQLYPFPVAQYDELLSRYPNLKELLWVQEEPQNMGAWRAVRHRLEEGLPSEVQLRYCGRAWRASPSEGYPTAHLLEQDRIVSEALDL